MNRKANITISSLPLFLLCPSTEYNNACKRSGWLTSVHPEAQWKDSRIEQLPEFWTILFFIGSYISLLCFWDCIYQVKGLSHCSISAVPEFTAKQGNMAINLIKCCCMWNTAPKALLSELHPSRADIKENKIVCNKRQQQTFFKMVISKWMAFFGKARFFKRSGYRTTDRICEKRGQSAPALIPISLSMFLAGAWVAQSYIGGAPLFSDPTADEIQMLVWFQCNSFKGSIFPQFSLKREAAVF